MPARQFARTHALIVAFAVAALFVFPVAWLFSRTEDAEFAARQQAAVTQRLGDVRAAIEADLSSRLAFPRALAAFAASRPELSREVFAAFARDLVRDTPAIRSIQLARNDIVSHVYPEESGILGLRLPADLPPQQAASVRELLATGRAQFTGPVTLLQGGRGFLARVPVFLGGDDSDGQGRPWGLATVIIDADAFFREVGLPQIHGVRLAIRQLDLQGQPGLLVTGPASVFDEAPQTATIAFPGGIWELAAVPAEGWGGSPGQVSLIGAALAVWAALGLTVWTFLSWPVRLRMAVDAATAELHAARAGLEGEVAARTRELETANQALRGLRDNAPIGIFTSTPDGRYLAVNACLAAMYGYASPEAMLRSVVNIQDQHYFDPDERDAVMDRINAEGLLLDHETRRLTRTGTVIWVLLNMRALRDAEGAVLRYEGFCTEISARKHAEATLSHQERQLRVIFDNSPLGLVYFDARGVVVKCNTRLLEALGTTADRVEGKELMPLYPEFIRRALAQALAGVPTQTEGRYASVTGGAGRPYIRVAFNPVDPGRQPSEVIATVEDITGQRETDAELRLLRAAVEASPTSIVITDATGKIEYVNPRFAELTGYTPDEAKGNNPRVLKSGTQSETFYRDMWATIAAGNIWRGEFCNRKKNGEIYWEDASISPIRDEAGVITHYVAVKEDITKRKELEAIREDVERIMRHDLKAPLNSIVNLPMIVAQLGEVNPEQGEVLDEIERAGQLMLEQIHLSLDLYKMETGTFHPVLQRVDLVLLTGSVRDMLAAPARDAGVTVTVEASAPQVFAKADALLCQTIFANLLKNAIEASAKGETVTIRVDGAARPTWAVHNPAQVPDAIRPVFFEKYATYGKRDGNGLGTYSARLMAECQGGNIRLDSGAAGTTVTVTLAA